MKTSESTEEIAPEREQDFHELEDRILIKQNKPIGDGVFDVVGRGVDEDTAVVPRSTLHPRVLVDRAQVLQPSVADCYLMLAEQRNV